MVLYYKWTHLIIVSCLALTVVVGCNKDIQVEPFQILLDEGKLVFTAPQGFQTLPPAANPLLPYEHAMRSEDGKLEVRYAIRPLSRVKIDYSDPHNSAPEPNHLFNMLFASLTEQLASGGDTPRREYTAQQAKELFNADWAAAALLDETTGNCPQTTRSERVALGHFQTNMLTWSRIGRCIPTRPRSTIENRGGPVRSATRWNREARPNPADLRLGESSFRRNIGPTPPSPPAWSTTGNSSQLRTKSLQVPDRWR